MDLDEADTEEPLEVVPKELTNQLLEMEQEHVAKKEARKKETSGEDKQHPRIFTAKGLAEASADLGSSLKVLRTRTPLPKGF